MKSTITTTIRFYRLNLKDPAERAEYEELAKTLRATPGRGHWMNTYGNRGPVLDAIEAASGDEIELETECLFDNQWNTAAGSITEQGARVFDWSEDIWPNADIKSGHYLEINAEMREVRRNTLKCGYCGNHEPAAKGYTFCPRCIGSEYLKEAELYLTRLAPCDKGLSFKRAPLTTAERDRLLPAYVDAQTTGATARSAKRTAKQRARVLADKAHSETETAGKLWLIDRGFDVGIVIYYPHTSKFVFGWRAPLSDAVVSRLLEVLSEFPGDYQIKGETRDYN